MVKCKVRRSQQSAFQTGHCFKHAAAHSRIVAIFRILPTSTSKAHQHQQSPSTDVNFFLHNLFFSWKPSSHNFFGATVQLFWCILSTSGELAQLSINSIPSIQVMIYRGHIMHKNVLHKFQPITQSLDRRLPWEQARRGHFVVTSDSWVDWHFLEQPCISASQQAQTKSQSWDLAFKP